MKRMLSILYVCLCSIQFGIQLILPVNALAYNLEADVSWDYSLEYQLSRSH